MTQDATNWLHEVLRLGRRILELTHDLDFDEYHSTEWPRIGVERYMISLGDAARAALNDAPELRERFPDLVKAIDMRNFLTHAYLHIDDLVVWNAVTEELPRLLEDVGQLFADRDFCDLRKAKRQTVRPRRSSVRHRAPGPGPSPAWAPARSTPSLPRTPPARRTSCLDAAPAGTPRR